MEKEIEKILPDSFEAENHYYEKVVNSHLHPLVRFFHLLDNERILERYCHLHPEVDRTALEQLLKYQPRYFRWAGADIFPTTNDKGKRNMVIIEVNSSPSGMKSFPQYDFDDDRKPYLDLLQNSFLPAYHRYEDKFDGAFAVLYDKNYTEVSGYAATLADLVQETVYLVPFYNTSESEKSVHFDNGVLKILVDGQWLPIKAAFKYVTQQPWNRIPVKSRTFIYNGIIACLSGGRNKLTASKAYDFFNGEYKHTGLQIHTPETIWDISKNEVPFWVKRMGGMAVVKNPYSNAGQGIYIITTKEDLDAFKAENHKYDVFIVQSLIGSHSWTSETDMGKLYHIGTVPTKKKESFVFDLRMMIISTDKGYRPVSIYARRARSQLLSDPFTGNSWDILGTNLSVKLGENEWKTDTNRLMIMGHKDFNKLGLGLDDLVEAFIQTVMGAVAIDKLSNRLISPAGDFKESLFRSLDPDESLIREIKQE